MSELHAGALPEATADLVDLFGDGVASVALPFRSFGGRARFSGAVVTLRCWEDNALLGTNPAKSTKTGAGQVDVTVEVAGLRFSPGDTVFCDEDGILVRH